MDQSSYSLAFSISNIGPKRFQMLLNHFGSAEKAWMGTKEEFESLEINGEVYKKFDEFRKSFNIKEYVARLEKDKVVFVGFLDKNYPPDLKKLENPPIGLFCKGNVELLPRHTYPEENVYRHSERSEETEGENDMFDPGQARMTTPDGGNELLRIAVVGTRKVTTYGKSVTESIVSDLSKSGACIVSGLALGIDGISHRTALENDAPTIAVLACGVDCCTPSEHYDLYSKILNKNGLITSEYPLSQPPNKGTFLARNRIVAALSAGVLVTEAAEDSGSLVTAGWGFTLAKKVFAVPGPINSHMSQGSLKLLKQGARLVTNGQDILENFQIPNSNFQMKLKFKNIKLKKEERKIVELLEKESMTIDEIAKSTKIKVAKLFVSLSGLELKGVVKNSSGKFSLLV